MSIKNSLSRFLGLQAYLLVRWNVKIAKMLHGTFLDIGCGKKKKEFFPHIKSYVGLEYPPIAGIIPEKSRYNPDVFGDGLYLPFKKSSFNCVGAFQVLEHVSRPDVLFQEAYRTLKKKGLFVLTIPFEYRIHLRPFDYFRFTKHGIEILAENAGFSIEHSEQIGGMWQVLANRLVGYLYSDTLGRGYGPQDQGSDDKPPWWLHPWIFITVPFMIIYCAMMEHLHLVHRDTLQYLVVLRK